jgi:hypothetical protein
MLGMHIGVVILDFASNPNDIYVIPSLIGKLITKRSLIVLPSTLIQGTHLWSKS